MAARRKTARKSTRRKSTARRSTARKSTARRSTARKTVRRRTPARRKTSARKVSSPAISTSSKPKKSTRDQELAAMHLSILIVGVAGIILLFAKPTLMMQKVIGILLVILGLWGLMMKK